MENVLYATQAAKNLLSVSRLVAKGATIVATKDNITIKKNGVIMNMNARKGEDYILMLYLRSKWFIPKGSSRQEENINIP